MTDAVRCESHRLFHRHRRRAHIASLSAGLLLFPLLFSAHALALAIRLAACWGPGSGDTSFICGGATIAPRALFAAGVLAFLGALAALWRAGRIYHQAKSEPPDLRRDLRAGYQNGTHFRSWLRGSTLLAAIGLGVMAGFEAHLDLYLHPIVSLLSGALTSALGVALWLWVGPPRGHSHDELERLFRAADARNPAMRSPQEEQH